jgi:hypothetical protein
MLIKKHKFVGLFFTHLFFAICLGVISSYAVSREMDFAVFPQRFFWIMFFAGILMMGIGQMLKTSFSVGTRLWKKEDLNSDLSQEQIVILLLSVAEVIASISFFILGGFISWDNVQWSASLIS